METEGQLNVFEELWSSEATSADEGNVVVKWLDESTAANQEISKDPAEWGKWLTQLEEPEKEHGPKRRQSASLRSYIADDDGASGCNAGFSMSSFAKAFLQSSSGILRAARPSAAFRSIMLISFSKGLAFRRHRT